MCMVHAGLRVAQNAHERAGTRSELGSAWPEGVAMSRCVQPWPRILYKARAAASIMKLNPPPLVRYEPVCLCSKQPQVLCVLARRLIHQPHVQVVAVDHVQLEALDVEGEAQGLYGAGRRGGQDEGWAWRSAANQDPLCSAPPAHMHSIPPAPLPTFCTCALHSPSSCPT